MYGKKNESVRWITQEGTVFILRNPTETQPPLPSYDCVATSAKETVAVIDTERVCSNDYTMPHENAVVDLASTLNQDPTIKLEIKSEDEDYLQESNGSVVSHNQNITIDLITKVKQEPSSSSGINISHTPRQPSNYNELWEGSHKEKVHANVYSMTSETIISDLVLSLKQDPAGSSEVIEGIKSEEEDYPQEHTGSVSEHNQLITMDLVKKVKQEPWSSSLNIPKTSEKSSTPEELQFSEAGDTENNNEESSSEHSLCYDSRSSKLELNSNLGKIRTNCSIQKENKSQVKESTTSKYNKYSHHGAVSQQSGEKTYFCDNCDYKSSNCSNFKRHLEIHNGENPYTCFTCGHKSKRKDKIARHIRTVHNGEKPHSCNICDYKCATKFTLNYHLAKHSDEKPYTCSTCGYKAKRKDHIARHIRAVHDGAKPLYTCSTCGYKAKHKLNIARHIRAVHGGAKSYTCNICGYKSLHKTSFTNHFNTHSDEKPYTCSLCSYKAKRKDHIARHIRAVHGGAKNLYTCSTCGYKAKNKLNIAQHIRAVHGGAKGYNCNICGYKSLYNSSFTIHLNSHTDEKPYTCSMCCYKTKRKDHIDRHIKTVHGRGKPFTCRICGSKCAQH